jgi:hypothetical protein
MALKEYKGGKIRTERTSEEVKKMLQDDYASLSAEEKETLDLLMQEMSDPAFILPEGSESEPPIKIYDALALAEYKHRPVDMETFVKDEYFLGNTCSSLFPKLLEDLKELFSGGYSELIATGAIGTGKTFMCSIAICRILYEISCLKNPQKSFGLAPGSPIAFAVFSVTETLAMKVAFDNIATKIETSPYFKENFPFNQTKRDLEFANDVQVSARAANMGAALGLNAIGFFIDEGNFMKTANKATGAIKTDIESSGGDTAQIIYDQMFRRMKSRYQRKGGKLPGMAIIASSKRTRDDFTAKRVKEAEDSSGIYVVDYSVWEVHPEDRYSKEKFHVLVGNESILSKILEPEEVPEALELEKTTDIVVLEVPVDFKHDFVRDLENSARDIGGVATVSISPFIHRRETLIECYSHPNEPKREHPFTTTEFDQTGTGQFIWSKLSRFGKIKDGISTYEGWEPLRYPNLPRYIHIDPSINSDATGIAMGCVTGFKEVQRRNLETQELFTEYAPEIWVDFMLRIIPPSGGEIDFGGIRQLVYELQKHGFHIGRVTMDQFQSVDTMQKFKRQGIQAEYLSVDRPMDPYDNLKAAFYEGRIHYYEYQPVLEELRALQHDKDKNKVDHPKKMGSGKGKKDVADALCGIVYKLSTEYEGPVVPISKGISEYVEPEHEENRALTDPEDDWIFPVIG